MKVTFIQQCNPDGIRTRQIGETMELSESSARFLFALGKVTVEGEHESVREYQRRDMEASRMKRPKYTKKPK